MCAQVVRHACTTTYCEELIAAWSRLHIALYQALCLGFLRAGQFSFRLTVAAVRPLT